MLNLFRTLIRIHFFLVLLLCCTNCTAQNNRNKMSDNPMLCNPDTGLCEMPAKGSAVGLETAPMPVKPTKPIQIIYFTDPICSSCWGIEPQLRRLKLEYGEYLHIDYRMGGLLPDWSYNSGGISKPSDVAGHWDEVSHHYDMPIDGDVWLEDPLPSSYPPSIAFKAAQMQDELRAIAFLRRIREMVFLEKKNITRWEHLQKAAEETGLDAALMKTAMEGSASQAFQKDLELARSMGVRGFPTLFFSDAAGNRLTLYGARPYAQFEQNLKALLPDASGKPFDTRPEALFTRYPTLTSREFSTLSGKPKAEVEQLLSDLFEAKKLRKTVTKNGVLWIWVKN